MKIRSIHIAGYGRFASEDITFAPGLQIIIGPNEKGKSTIRAFVADMLYGQKRNETQRDYEESNALRAPWNGAESYGGSLTYELDDGRVFEIIRNFDKERESIQIFDRVANNDVTNAFARFRNRELDFAQQHLGLAKEVFLNTATISHMSLNDLGDSEALERIREMMLSLTDSGRGTGTVEAALDALSRRIASIGRPDAKSKPLPQARLRAIALEAELREAGARQESLRGLAAARRQLLDACAALQEERQAAEASIQILDLHDEAKRLEHADEVAAQRDAAKRGLAGLAANADFPSHRDGDVQALQRDLQAAESQLARSQSQHEALEAKRSAPPESPHGVVSNPEDFPRDLERQLDEMLANKAQLSGRIQETHTLLTAARERMTEVQSQLAEMPDFSRLAADPVEWLSQLANSFAVARRARDEECAAREVLRKEVEALEDLNTPLEGLFSECSDFAERAREYEIQARVHDEQVKRAASELHSLQISYDEAQGENQAFLPIGIICVVLAVGIYLMFGNDMWIHSIIILALGLVFIGMRSDRKGRLSRLKRSIEAAEGEAEKMAQADPDENFEVIADILKESGLDTVRELEAQYDEYRSNMMELKIRREAFESQSEKAQEAEERIPQLLARFKDTFSRAGESIVTENDVQDAASRAIARYQGYREAKRRATSNRSVLERHQTELQRLEALERTCEAELAAQEREARLFIQERGFTNIDAYPAVKELIAAYRQSLADSREVHGRQELLAESLQQSAQQLADEAREVDQLRERLAAILAEGGVASIDDWTHRVAAAREHQNLESQIQGLEDHLADILGNQSIASLREHIARAGELPARPEQSRDTLREAMARLGESIERKRQEERELHEQLTQESVRSRPMAAIEEELAAAQGAIRDLEAEIDAASYTMALLEDVAQDKHAEIAPRLAQQASTYLEAITQGNYNELSVGRDLRISVRIPQTDQLNEAPEKSLSKGTVDQIYLALRLAFVQCVSQNGERIPMLLDDPFANYDDVRLESALRLIAESVGNNQILLFTCREDVVSVAKRLNASVIRL